MGRVIRGRSATIGDSLWQSQKALKNIAEIFPELGMWLLEL